MCSFRLYHFHLKQNKRKMIPVKQTKVVVKNKDGVIVQNGNCYAAAIASMLEVPITEVPNVEVFFPFDSYSWQTLMLEFLRLKGYDLCTDMRFRIFHRDIIAQKPTEEEARFYMEFKDQYYFAVGKSSRGVNHIVICKCGEIIHDPHPSNDGLETFEWFEAFDKIS